MKESTKPDPLEALAQANGVKPAGEEKKPSYKPPVLWEMVRMEGGLTLLIIFPLVVLYYLKMAYR